MIKKKKTHAYLVEIEKIASVERVPLLAGCAIIALSLKKGAEKGKGAGENRWEEEKPKITTCAKQTDSWLQRSET